MIVLDAWALLAFLNDEPSAALIEDSWIDQGAAASELNLGEVLYIRARSHGLEAASSDIELVRRRLKIVSCGWDEIQAAAKIKARGGLSFADAFCLSAALGLGSELWTGDPEILRLAGDLGCRTRDLSVA